MDGEMPKGWRKTTVGHVARVDTGGTPSRSKPEYWGGDILWMSSGEVRLKRVRGTAERITRAGLDGSNAKLFPPGTVMVALNGQGRTRGSVAVLEVEAACNQSLAAILPGPELDGRFLLQNLSTRYDELRSLTGDDARNGLNLHLIRSLPMVLPELCEQAAIARVLNAIDEAIEKTEVVIAATEDLRKALLQELLTRGVPGWHSEWKTVPGIGTIPACWEVARLGEVAEVTSGIALGPARAPNRNRVRYLTVANVQADRVDLGEPRFMELTASEMNTKLLSGGDVLMVEGHANVTQLGRCALAPTAAEGLTFQNHLFRIRGLADRLLNGFLAAVVNGPVGRRYFEQFGGTTSGLNTVSSSSVKRLQMPLPSTREQEQIVASVASIRARETCERRQLDGLRELKAWTAEALLSGRVRVPVEEVS